VERFRVGSNRELLRTVRGRGQFGRQTATNADLQTTQPSFEDGAHRSGQVSATAPYHPATVNERESKKATAIEGHLDGSTQAAGVLTLPLGTPGNPPYSSPSTELPPLPKGRGFAQRFDTLSWLASSAITNRVQILVGYSVTSRVRFNSRKSRQLVTASIYKKRVALDCGISTNSNGVVHRSLELDLTSNSLIIYCGGRL
jgi:hypothetical protein